jgi:c-di-GMP-binding flagellar brake protein YcgR
MLHDILSIGDKIDIRRVDQKGRLIASDKVFASQLVNFEDQDVIHIGAPISLGHTILLEVDEGYNLIFYTAKGLYQSNCVILRNYKENNVVITVVRLTSNLEKLQRRQYYRLECIHEVDYRLITREEEQLEQKVKTANVRNLQEQSEGRKKLLQIQQEWQKASITDISGGGVRFTSANVHNKGDHIWLKLGFIAAGENKEMVLNACIISSSRILNRFDTYEHRAEFINISKKDREELIKYIFEQDRLRRKNK